VKLGCSFSHDSIPGELPTGFLRTEAYGSHGANYAWQEKR